MKLTLEFTLPEEEVEADQALRGKDAFRALYELEQYLRNIVKYSEREEWKNAGEIRDQFYEILNDLNLELF